MSSAATVAIVIPCFNHGEFLGEALASVAAQTRRPDEVVVVDDGSTQPATLAALDAAERAGARVLHQTNQGLAAARNAGIRATTAAFFAPLDADDRLAPRFVELLLPPLLADPRLGYAYGQAQCFGTQRGLWRCPAYDPARLVFQNLCTATALLRRAAFDAAGGYNRDMTWGFEDWDFWLALLTHGYHGRCIPSPLFLYRKHAPGVSMLDRMQPRADEMLRRMIAHHRPLYVRYLLGGRETGPDGRAATDETLRHELLARIELDRIESSNLWRRLRWLATPDLRRPFDARGERDAGEWPSQRLARLCSSRPLRLIRALKRLPPYRWYAARRFDAQTLARLDQELRA